MRFRRTLLIAAAGVGCGAPTQEPAVAAVTLAPSAAEMAVGAVVPFEATVTDANGNVLQGRQVFWASQDSSIVAVSDLGVATARRPGTTQIAASAEGHADIAVVTVRSAGDNGGGGGGNDGKDGGHGHGGHGHGGNNYGGGGDGSGGDEGDGGGR